MSIKVLKPLFSVLLSALLLLSLGGPVLAQSVNARNMLKIARSYASQGDWERTKEYAERALKEDASYVDALYMRAFAHRELEEYKKAEADFREVIRRKPAYLPTYGALAEIFVKLKEYDKANQLFADLGNQPNGAKWSNYYRGVIAYLKADLPAAEKFWNSALTTDKTFTHALHNLGALYLAQGDYVKALVKFRAALREQPEKALYRLHTAWALERTGQTALAQDMLKKVMDENVDDQKNWLLAKALDRLTRNQPKLALPSLQAVAESNPDNLDVWVLLGRTHIALNQPDEAREALEKAKEMDGAFQEVDTLLSKLPAPAPSAPDTEETPEEATSEEAPVPAETPSPESEPPSEEREKSEERP